MVKWFVEVFDQDDEKVAIATVLTMVAKKSPFVDINRGNANAFLNKLTEDTKAQWGIMSPQHMVEHLAYVFDIATEKIEVPIHTPEEHLEKYQDSLYNYRPMPVEYKHPLLKQDKTEDLRYENLAEAKAALLEAWDNFEAYFKENPGISTNHVTFGKLDKDLWDLMNRKHLNHHFKQFGLI